MGKGTGPCSTRLITSLQSTVTAIFGPVDDLLPAAVPPSGLSQGMLEEEHGDTLTGTMVYHAPAADCAHSAAGTLPPLFAAMPACTQSMAWPKQRGSRHVHAKSEGGASCSMTRRRTGSM